MITMRGDDPDGTPVIIMGLTRENVDRLVGGEPINVLLRQMGVNSRVVVIFGETEQKMIRQLEEVGAVPPGTASDMPSVDNEAEQAYFNPVEGWEKSTDER